MSISRQEEIIAALWALCALIAFSSQYTFWGWVFAVKAAADTVCAMCYGVKEVLAERDREKLEQQA